MSTNRIDELTTGGGEMHTSVSGVADHLATSDSHAIRLAREAVRDLGDVPVPPKVGAERRTSRLNDRRIALSCRPYTSLPRSRA